MVAEQTDQTYGKHSGDEEQEHNMKSPHTPVQLAAPKQQEIPQRGHRHVDTVQKGVAQEQNEELVVAKVHAIVYPRAVVIELKDTDATNAAVMCPVRFDHLATVAKSNGSRVRSIHDRQFLCDYIEDLFLLLLTRRLGQFL